MREIKKVIIVIELIPRELDSAILLKSELEKEDMRWSLYLNNDV